MLPLNHQIKKVWSSKNILCRIPTLLFIVEMGESILKTMLEKSKITKILNSEENQIGKSLITWQNNMTKHIKNEWTRTVIFLTWYRHYEHFIVYVYFPIVFEFNLSKCPVISKWWFNQTQFIDINQNLNQKHIRKFKPYMLTNLASLCQR